MTIARHCGVFAGLTVFCCVIFFAFSVGVYAYDMELRDLDVSDWSCLDRPGGDDGGKKDRLERNEMKGRRPIDTTGMQFPALDWNGFLELVRGYDHQLGAVRRTEITTKDQQRNLFKFQDRTVSITGWLLVAYPGPGESCNCNDKAIHDWHLEVFENRSDHAPDIGDPTGIICEVSPRTEQTVYKSGVRIQNLARYVRLEDLTDQSTGHAAHKVRITGYILWDDEHNGENDIGKTIERRDVNKGYYHPWRQTAWEIHPVFAIEDLGTE
jgi:hypothetical protein